MLIQNRCPCFAIMQMQMKINIAANLTIVRFIRTSPAGFYNGQYKTWGPTHMNSDTCCSKPYIVLCALVEGLWPKLVLQFINFLTSKLDFTAACLWLQTFCMFLWYISMSLEAVYLMTFRLRIKNILKSVDNLWFTKIVVAVWNFVTLYLVFVSLTFSLWNHWKESCIIWIENVV